MLKLYRITMRFSLDRDSGSKIRNTIVPKLKKVGFENIKTGTWEVYSENSQGICDAVAEALKIAEQSGKLDHYWLHVEKLSLRQATKILKAAESLTKK